MDPDLDLCIDLYNMEDKKFEGSKYVLTSPRSLEACSRLNIKPVELLHKPLSEFQEELLPQDIPLRTIYAVYEESEQIRQKKMKLCQEERKRIRNDDKQEISKLNNHKDRTLKRIAGKNHKSGLGGQTLMGSVDNESTKLHRELLSKKERNSNHGKPTAKKRPQSAQGRKTQRCTSVVLADKFKVRWGSAPHDIYRLPARDKKILKLMQERRESELRDLNLSKQAHKLWEDQRRRDEALKIIVENKRREMLAEENRVLDMQRMEAQERRVKEEECKKEVRQHDIADSQLRAETDLLSQLRLRELQISDRIRKEAAMKEIQEINVKTKEKEDVELKQFLLAKQITNQNSATERKERKTNQESLNKFLINKQERDKFERRQNSLKSQQQESNLLVISSIEQKLIQARENLSQITEQRNQEISSKHHEELIKLQRARSACRKLDAEMDAWRAELQQQEKLKEEKAARAMSCSLELKSLQARRNRVLKQLDHKKNISRILKDDETYRYSLEKSIQQKEKKIEEIKDHKEKTIAQTRAMAQLSQTLRDDIKGKYESDTFDKKSLEAKLYASITREKRCKSPVWRNNASAYLS